MARRNNRAVLLVELRSALVDVLTAAGITTRTVGVEFFSVIKRPFLAVAIGQEKTAPIDPGGWNKAKWGINQSQISDVFPEAKLYEVPEIERGSKRLLPKGDVVGQVQFIQRSLSYDPSAIA